MLDLATCQPEDVIRFAQDLWRKYLDQPLTFETVSQELVDVVWESFVVNGVTPWALLRVFRISPQADLHPNLQQLVTDHSERWLTLMATRGLEPAWNHREQSQGHQVIPLNRFREIPMISAMVSQLNLKVASEQDKQLRVNRDNRAGQTRYFFVEQALDSAYIPAQKEFVERYHIQSVIDIGANLLGNTGVVMLGFAAQPLTPTMADSFAGIAPFVSTLLSSFNQPDRLWEAQG